MQSIENKALSRIHGHGRGWVFTPVHFSDLGNSESVRKALQSLVSRGAIRRISRGLYDYPSRHPKLGELAATPEQIAKALAGKEHAKLQPTGAYAANLLGLSLQVPAKVEFLTDGRSRTVKVGNQTIKLKQTTPKNMAAADRITGLIIQALRFIGRDNVNSSVISKLAERLSAEDRQTLIRDIKLAPAWIADVFRTLAELEK
ncbi:MAG: hypothetical protein F9B45_29145 [Phycisphaera sp. RhM]|nr:hypothetical protein [Phycisphaera sp. RhM]